MGQFFKICPNMSQNWLKLRKFWKNQVILLQIWSKIGPIADVAISKRPLLFTVWTQLRMRSHQNFYARNFGQLLRVTRKRSCTFAGNVQAQLHFRDDQQRAFGISNISNWYMNGSLFLEKLVFVWVFFQIPLRHVPTETQLEYLPGKQVGSV